MPGISKIAPYLSVKSWERNPATASPGAGVEIHQISDCRDGTEMFFRLRNSGVESVTSEFQPSVKGCS